MTELHVYPVPRGYTPEQAWAEIQVFGELRRTSWWQVLCRPTWAVMEVGEPT